MSRVWSRETRLSSVLSDNVYNFLSWTRGVICHLSLAGHLAGAKVGPRNQTSGASRMSSFTLFSDKPPNNRWPNCVTGTQYCTRYRETSIPLRTPSRKALPGRQDIDYGDGPPSSKCSVRIVCSTIRPPADFVRAIGHKARSQLNSSSAPSCQWSQDPPASWHHTLKH